MKKILIILLLFVWFFSDAQIIKKISDLPSTPVQSGMFFIVDVDTNSTFKSRKVPIDSIQKYINVNGDWLDSISVHRTEIDALFDTAGVHRNEINDLTDTVIIHRIDINDNKDTLLVLRSDLNTLTATLTSHINDATIHFVAGISKGSGLDDDTAWIRTDTLIFTKPFDTTYVATASQTVFNTTRNLANVFDVHVNDNFYPEGYTKTGLSQITFDIGLNAGDKVTIKSHGSNGTGGGSGGVVNFLELSDTPGSYSGQSGKVVAVNGAENGVEFIAAGGGGGGTVMSILQTQTSASGSGPSGTQPILFTVAFDIDNSVIEANATTDRITVKQTGNYVVEYTGTLGSAGGVMINIQKNGGSFDTQTISSSSSSSGDDQTCGFKKYYSLTANDYLELELNWTSDYVLGSSGSFIIYKYD